MNAPPQLLLELFNTLTLEKIQTGLTKYGISLLFLGVCNCTFWYWLTEFFVDKIIYENGEESKIILEHILNKNNYIINFSGKIFIKNAEHKKVRVPIGWVISTKYIIHVNIPFDGNHIITLYGTWTINYFQEIFDGYKKPILPTNNENENENMVKVNNYPNNIHFDFYFSSNGGGLCYSLYEFQTYFSKANYHSNVFRASKLIYDKVQANELKNGIFYLYGIPGTGKTTTARYLSKMLNNAYLCENFGDVLQYKQSLYAKIIKLKQSYQTKSDIHILVIDEFDVLLDNKITSYTSMQDNYYKYKMGNTKILNKKDWNYFADMCNITKNIIIILTSNKEVSHYHDKNSILRKNRIAGILHFTNDTVEEVGLNESLRGSPTPPLGSPTTSIDTF